MSELKLHEDRDALCPVRVGLRNYFVSRETITEAIAMRDRISADFAAIYLQFKGVSMDAAMSILSMSPHQFAMATAEEH